MSTATPAELRAPRAPRPAARDRLRALRVPAPRPELAALLVLRMRGEQVEAVRVIADPAQIGFLGRHLAASAR